MKKLIYLASMLLAFAFASCEDFLTVHSVDQLTSDSFWRNEKDAEAGMAAAYTQLYHGDRYAISEVRWPVEAYRTDLYDMGNDARNYSTWTDLYHFTYTNGNTQFSYYYSDLYRGINYANQVLINLPNVPTTGISEEKRAALMAEGKFLRGYYHLMLLLNWEKIIIRNEMITTDAQLNKPLSERAACWDFIIDELQAAADGLPAKRGDSDMGRATSGAANSYLGFAYLTRAYEESAKQAEYLDKALAAFNKVHGYALVSGDELINMFNGTNKNCAESIFELQSSKSDANGARYDSCIHWWIGVSEFGGWDEILPNKFLMDEFMKEGEIATTGRYDSRLYNTVYFQCDYFNDGTGRVLGQNYDEIFSKEDENGNPQAYNRPAFRRFTPATAAGYEQSTCAFNIPLMRYANVLLMKAEALNLKGNTAEAIAIINEIRRVHGDMPAMKGSSKEDVQAQIEHERIVEFPLESYRWYDLRRWGKTNEAMQAAGRTNYKDSEHRFYPIPLWEINSNPAVSE